jgi:formylglycine-generating enzyme required for sulfatase activity
MAALPLLHQKSGLVFLAVPGGEFQMGISEQDLLELSEFVDWDSTTAGMASALAEKARPVRRVRVEPFLCTRRLVTQADLVVQSQLGLSVPSFRDGGYERDASRRFARSLGFRLPSEAELEWLARDGSGAAMVLDLMRGEDSSDEYDYRGDPYRPSRFGVLDQFDTQWAEDDFHSNYEGAPATSHPWFGGDNRGVCRGCDNARYPELGQETIVWSLAGARFERNAAGFRLAMPLDLGQYQSVRQPNSEVE